MKNLKRIGIFLMAALFVFLGGKFSVPARAAEQTGTITFHFDGMSDISFSIYQVATPDGKGNFILTEDFADSQIDVTAKTAAASLEQYVLSTSTIEPLDTQKTDQTGQIVFSDMEQGAYLILGESFQKDGYTYGESPVLVSVPTTEGDSKDLVYDVKVDAKYGKTGAKEITVKKVWYDANNLHNTRTTSITANLYQDGTFYSQQELSASNNWTYTWKDLDSSKTWSVKEDVVPEKYQVSYEKQDDGKTLVIKNTYQGSGSGSVSSEDEDSDSSSGSNGSGSGSGSGSSSSSSGLPQTGQLWWPVGIMLCAGLIFIIIGLRIRRRKD